MVGTILLEDDIAVQQVVHLQLQVEVLVQAISGAEVQRVQRLLPDIAQTRHAYRMVDAGTGCRAGRG